MVVNLYIYIYIYSNNRANKIEQTQEQSEDKGSSGWRNGVSEHKGCGIQQEWESR